MSPPIARIILYVNDIGKIAAFYRKYFDMRPRGSGEDDWVELAADDGGCTLALHRAAVSQKSGAAVKIVFGVRDVDLFKKKCRRNGLKFGPTHYAGGFEFANAKDPAGNSISISSRGLADPKGIFLGTDRSKKRSRSQKEAAEEADPKKKPSRVRFLRIKFLPGIIGI